MIAAASLHHCVHTWNWFENSSTPFLLPALTADCREALHCHSICAYTASALMKFFTASIAPCHQERVSAMQSLKHHVSPTSRRFFINEQPLSQLPAIIGAHWRPLLASFLRFCHYHSRRLCLSPSSFPDLNFEHQPVARSLHASHLTDEMPLDGAFTVCRIAGLSILIIRR